MNLETFDYIIAPRSYHAWYLRQKQGRWQDHFQLITKEQFLGDLRFRFDIDEALLMVVKRMQLSPGEALKRLVTLQTLDAEALDHPQLAPIFQPLYDCLKEANLIQTNPLALPKYQGKVVLVDGYLSTDRPLFKTLKSLGIKATLMEPLSIERSHKVKVCESVEDEVSLMFNQVVYLRQQGTPLNHIKVLLPNQEAYRYEVERQAGFYQIPLQKPVQTTLYALPLTQRYLEGLRRQMKEAAIWEMLTTEDSIQAQMLQASLPKLPYESLPFQTKLSFLEQYFQHTYVKEPRYAQAIQIVQEGLPSPEDHVFILGMIQGEHPTVQRDKSMIEPSLQITLGLETSSDRYQTKRLRFQHILARSEHLYVSYARLLEGKVTVAHPLIATLGWQVEPSSYLVNQTDYSGELAKLRLGKFAYYQKQFNQPQPYLKAYQQALPSMPATFDYAFTSLDVDLTQKPLRLSYSALKDYYQCSFKYFVGRILKVKPMDQDEFYMHLGTFAHEVFETIGDTLDNFEAIFNTALENQKQLSPKEVVLFSHLKDQLRKVCEFNLVHRQHMAPSSIEAEKEMFYQHDEQTSLVGYIDKVMLLRSEQGKEYIAVVDYKSGAESFDERLIQYGWSLQLPIYALMLAHHPDYADKDVLGLFIQHIIETSMNPDEVEIDGKSFPKKYQLDGIIVNDPEIIRLFDDTFQTQKTTFLEGVQILKKGGFRQSGHVQSKEAFQTYAETAKEKIEDAARSIRQGEFPINPKNIARKSACDYCPFIDTCFRKASDVQIITLPKKGETTDGDLD
ncbi:MAG: PD-(D/E)XK nuclease family protein [Bacilli bacterium]